VNDVSLGTRAGEIIGLVGPNGAGKSTLVQLMTGIIQPTVGTIFFGDRVISRRPPEEIAALGIARTFQTSRVFPGLTVLESVLIGGQVDVIGGGRRGRRMTPFEEFAGVLARVGGYGRRAAALQRRAEAVLAIFGDRLLPRSSDLASSLSYANRRRLELARALISEPLVLLLDEPTAGMNPTETDELAQVIAQLSRERPEMAILIIEHKMHVIRDLCRAAMVMHQGSLIASGPPNEVLQDQRVVEAYLGATATAVAR